MAKIASVFDVGPVRTGLFKGRINQYLLLSACCSVFLLGTSIKAKAETTVVSNPDSRMAVVELYTSEGCSSCPPADERLSKLGQRQNPDVLPLAFHVDYWDYLGWKDDFSKAQFTERQRRLGDINQQRTIYTPEFFVDGVESRRSRAAKIKQTTKSMPEAELRLSFNESQAGTIETTLKAMNIVRAAGAQVFFAITENNLARKIGDGENSGRTLHHDHVVRLWSGPFDLAEGKVMKTLHIDPSWQREQLTLAAIVKDVDTGRTLQAVVSPLSVL